MSQTYDRLAAGERIRARRRLLGFTQEEMAERIGRVPKYYADIERGNCGMSVETLLALSRTIDLSLDYIILGEGKEGEETYGMLYTAEIRKFEKELHSEIEKILITKDLPEKWTYPEIQPVLMREAKIRRGGYDDE